MGQTIQFHVHISNLKSLNSTLDLILHHRSCAGLLRTAVSARAEDSTRIVSAEPRGVREGPYVEVLVFLLFPLGVDLRFLIDYR